MQDARRKIQDFFFKKPNLSLFLVGAAATLALPPLNILPLGFFSLAFLLHQLICAEAAHQAFARGACWGLGYFIFGLYWVSFALTLHWPEFAWLMPFSILGLPGLMTFYVALMGAGLFTLAQRFENKKLATILFFPVFWTGSEWLRGNAFTGFPWNLIGTTFTDFTPLFQTAAIIGVYGLGFVIAAITSLWMASYELPKSKFALQIICVAIIAVMLGFGYWRTAEPVLPTKTLHVRIVQPNISQEGKWDLARRTGILNTLLRLTAEPAARPPDIVVWPEAAAPFILAETPNVRMAIARAMPPGATLITGAIRRDSHGQFFNSIEYLDSSGSILGHYDKSHLVPFGEYMPFAKYIPLPAVAQFFGDMGRGPGPQTQFVDGAAISPLICYEAIFPGEVTNIAPMRPQLLVNVTDDAWYGKTAGPHQHLAEVRARAVEEGIPLIRSANTGISAAADRYGRVTAELPFGTEGVIDTEVQLATNTSPPPAAGGGFYGYLGALMLVYLFGSIFLLKTKKL